jgi:16S rRNA (adenine1518-N6/adenine1519-N6)-dimethyltransferase
MKPPVQIDDEAVFEALVRQAFAQRRKTLRNTLRGTLEVDEIRAAGVDPGVRAETLPLNAFAALANRAARRN